MTNTRNDRVRRQSRWAAAVALGTVVALLPSMTWAQDRGQCARIETPWSVILPDGSTHEAGSLNLCLQQMWTPASGLHEIQVNGVSLGLYTSRVATSERPVEDMPVVVFQRTETDERQLLGYAWPDGEFMRTYILQGTGKSSRAITRNSRLPLLESVTTEVLIAALP
jgi:hypothetical protein